MPGRHRRPVLPRTTGRRLAGAGAAGVLAALAVAPAAYADEVATDTTTTSVPTDASDATTGTPAETQPESPTDPSTGTPTDAPTDAPSDTPTDAPSDTPTDAPTDTPTDAPTTTPTTSPATPAAKAPVPAKARALAAPDYGRRKVTVTASVKPGATAPSGTAGSVFTIDETGPAPRTSPATCTTSGSGQTSSCSEFVVAAGNQVTVTQQSAPGTSTVDPSPQSLPVCTTPDTVVDRESGFSVPGCSSTLTFADSGPLPTATGTFLDVRVNTSVTVTPNVDDKGSAITSVDVDQPAHGTVTVQQGPVPMAGRAVAVVTPVAGAFTLVYTPTKDYVGGDSFRYRVTTNNGTSAYATVYLDITGTPPTAVDDRARTTEGRAVTVDVLANDSGNGGGVLKLDEVMDGEHGYITDIRDGRVTYTPNDGFTGTDRFTYSVHTYSGDATATVTISVVAAAKRDDRDSDNGDRGNRGDTDNGAGTNGATESTAATGAPSAALIEIGGALLLAGAGATVVGRRRRDA